MAEDFMERANGNRTHVRSLGSLINTVKNAQIGGILSFLEILKWIPIGAAACLAVPTIYQTISASHIPPWQR
jgi:hypothetical protein